MKTLFKYFIAACLSGCLASPQASAQFGNTYYHMLGVPQANQLNPAFQPNCNGYLAMPFLGPLRFEAESTGFGYGDIFEWVPSEKKYITFMHPDGNKQKFMDALKPINLIRAEFASNLLSVGWRKDDFYFTIDLTERIIEGFAFPKDYAEFALNGNLNKEIFNLSDLAQSLKYFHEFAVGASYNYEDELQFGARLKLLLGVGSFETQSTDIGLKASMDEWKIDSDIRMNATLPFIDRDITMDSLLRIGIEAFLDAGPIGGFFAAPDEMLDAITAPAGIGTLAGIRNPGFAIDVGFSYRPIERLSVSASAVDLGFIKWKNYTYNLHQEMDYTFEGLEFKLEEDYDPAEGLADSILSSMKLRVTENPYTTTLSGKVYLGVAYDLTGKVRFGGVFRTRVRDYKFYNQFTVSANVQPISMFSASISYSVYGNSYMNLGLGLSLRAGPFNLYFITDQAPSAYFWPEEFSSLNFRLGMNIVWGCRAMPKAMKDRPLID